MKNYIIISNVGFLTPEDLTLLGSSQKGERTEETIGQYGSGMKFSNAYYLREKLDLRVFSGTEEIKLSTKEKDHRGNTVEVICIDGKETDITTSFGREAEWTGWMALRETYSNAIDGGDANITTQFNPEIKGTPGRVTFFIEMNEDLKFVMNNFEEYFSFGLTPVHSNIFGLIYKQPKKGLVLHRKGIRVVDSRLSQETEYFYDSPKFEINESRVIRSNSDAMDIVRRIVKHCTDKNIIRDLFLEENGKVFSTNSSATTVEVAKELSAEGYVFYTDSMKLLTGKLEKKIIIPSYLYSDLVEKEAIPDFLENYILSKGGDVDSRFIKMGDCQELTYRMQHIFPNIKVEVGEFIEANKEVAYTDGKIQINASKHEYFKSEPSTLFSNFMYGLSYTQLEKLYLINADLTESEIKKYNLIFRK